MKLIRLCLLLVVIILAIECFAGCAVVNEAGAFFAARDMRKAIENADVLTRSADIVAVNYNDINAKEYAALNKALDRFEQQQKMAVLRLFVVEGNKCFFVARHSGAEDKGGMVLYSIGIDGKDVELIRTIDEGKGNYLSYRDFDGATTVETPAYSALPAYYYQGKIVVNGIDMVFEYDTINRNITEYDVENYEYPMNDVELSFNDGVLYVKQNGEVSQITIQELIESSPEMRYLYELTEQQRDGKESESFFEYYIYYDAEPYIVFRPMSKYGLSFGALFKFEPDTKTVTYIDCVFTNDFPDCVYPIIVK